MSNDRRAAAGMRAAFQALMRTTRETGPLRMPRLLLRMNQHGGFDCPGCAWPEPAHSFVAEFCENGAKAVSHEATLQRLEPGFFSLHRVQDLRTRDGQWLEAQGRLVQPLRKAAGSDHYEPVSWDEAFARIGAAMQALDSPDRAVFYTSGRTSNEAAFLWQLLAREFGTNNLPDCSNMCHESSGTGLGETIGVGKGTVGLDDFDQADAIFILGQNPGSNHPRMMTALQRAKERGCRIVSINPLRELGLVRFSNPQRPLQLLGASTELTDLYLQVRIGGDIALLKGIAKHVLAMEDARPGTVLDHAFLAEFTSGFDEMAAALQATTWEDLERESGIPRAQMKEAADVYVGARSVIACWAMGLTQHRHGVANVREVTNLLLLRGNVGRPGAGLCPVRGHSNVQGDRTMGIWERPTEAFLASLDGEFGIRSPRAHGFDTVETLQAMLDGRVGAFLAMGGNFAAAAPDRGRAAEALRRCPFSVHVATKLNLTHVLPDGESILLPALGRTERDVQAGGAQFVTVEDSMSMVHRSEGTLAPASEHLQSEAAIVAGVATAALGTRSRVPWQHLVADYRRIRARIEKVVPGFERFEERLQEPGGFRLPNAARERRFATVDGRARFTVNALPGNATAPGEFLLMTIRSHDQFNTTVYGKDDVYRGIEGERDVLFVNEDDARDLGLDATSRVDVVACDDGGAGRAGGRSEAGVPQRLDGLRVQRRLNGLRVQPYGVPRGCLATYFPEGNVLCALEDFAEGSRTPNYKSVRVRIVAR